MSASVMALVVLVMSWMAAPAEAVVSTFDVDAGGVIQDIDVTLFTFNVSGLTGPIVDVNLRLSLAHDFLADLDVRLIGPDNTSVLLFEDFVDGAAMMQDTLLDDGAALAITSGASPFLGSYRPVESLSAFNGKDANGTWALRFFDDLLIFDGVLYAPGDATQWQSPAVGTQLIITTADSVIPEPMTVALGAMGLLAIAGAAQRRRA